MDPTGSGHPALPRYRPGVLRRSTAVLVVALAIGAAGTTDVTGASGPEFLSAALAPPKEPGSHRRADVYLYDYTADQLIKQVVDVTAGRLERTFSADGRQPPASAREVRVATDLLLGHPLGELLRSRYHASTGFPLTSTAPELLAVSAQVFVAVPGETALPVASCGAHRCLILLPRPTGRVHLDLTDIVVDLSARTVIQLP